MSVSSEDVKISNKRCKKIMHNLEKDSSILAYGYYSLEFTTDKFYAN